MDHNMNAACKTRFKKLHFLRSDRQVVISRFNSLNSEGVYGHRSKIYTIST